MATRLDVPSGAVVVGFDGSPRSRRAVDWAVEEAGRRDAPLLIVYVAEMPTLAGAPRSVSATELVDLGEQMVAAEVERVRAEAPDLTVSGGVHRGRAAVGLVGASERASVVVVGARGLGAVAGVLLGSVSQKVAAHADGPVVVVRQEAPPEMPGPVVVGADPGDPPIEALKYGFDEARRRGVAVLVVSAREGSRRPSPFSPSASAMLAKLAEEKHEQLCKIVDEMAAECGVTAEVRQFGGYPVDAILGVAGVDSLVVVGSRGHGGLASLKLGSVSRGVLQRSVATAVARVHADPDAED